MSENSLNLADIMFNEDLPKKTYGDLVFDYYEKDLVGWSELHPIIKKTVEEHFRPTGYETNEELGEDLWNFQHYLGKALLKSVVDKIPSEHSIARLIVIKAFDEIADIDIGKKFVTDYQHLLDIHNAIKEGKYYE